MLLGSEPVTFPILLLQVGGSIETPLARVDRAGHTACVYRSTLVTNASYTNRISLYFCSV